MKVNIRIFNFSIKIFIFGLLLIFIWTPLHEFVHYNTLKFFGHKAVYVWQFSPYVQCLDCNNFILYETFLYAISPYLVDLIILILFLLFRNKIFGHFSWFAYLDILANFIFIPFSLERNDFIILSKIGFWYVPMILFIVSTLLFYNLNKRKINEITTFVKNTYG